MKDSIIIDISAFILIDVKGTKRTFVTDDGGSELHIEGMVNEFGVEVYGEKNIWEVEEFCENHKIKCFRFDGAIQLTSTNSLQIDK